MPPSTRPTEPTGAGGRRSERRTGTRRRVIAVLVILASVAVLRPDGSRTVDASQLTVHPAAAAQTPTADAGSGPTPPVPADLPAGIESASPYLEQVSCDPVDKPGAIALGRLLVATYPGTSYSISRPCGVDGMASEHYEGRAVDWFTSVRTTEGQARANALLDWLLAPDAAGHAFANARRLGVMYIIWDDHIWGSYAAAAGWRAYNGCASRQDRSWDTLCHRDHVHLSLSWAGAAGRTSYWTGQVAPVDYGPCRPADLNWAAPYSGANPRPCPSYPAATAPAGASSTLVGLTRYSGATVGVMSGGPVVSALQKALGVTADGAFGPLTAQALAAFQRGAGLAPTGRTDAATWRALLASLAGGGTPTSPPPTSKPVPSTPAPTPPAPPPSTPTPPTDIVQPRPSTPATPSTPSTPSGTSTGGVASGLRYGARGASVLKLQRALGVQPASGWFGPKTWTAVAAVQRAHHLPVTGIVDTATWRAVFG